MAFDPSVLYYMEFLCETSQIYLTPKVTYCDKGVSLYALTGLDRSKKVLLTCSSFTMWYI